MAGAKIEVKCAYCDAIDTFIDTKDITHSGWYIIGWDMVNTIPIVSCKKCPVPFWKRTNDYIPPKPKKVTEIVVEKETPAVSKFPKPKKSKKR